MTIDVLTAAVGIISFIAFLLVHLITFRWVHPENLMKSLLLNVLVMLVFPVILMGVLFTIKAVDISWEGWVAAILLAILIEGLMCSFYVLCIFGPLETSVRMRLVREIALAPTGGILMKEILQRYNDETILNVRLRRLVGSGDIIEKDGRYRAGHSRNFFIIFDAIAGVIKKWIGR